MGGAIFQEVAGVKLLKVKPHGTFAKLARNCRAGSASDVYTNVIHKYHG